jgi:predicted nucleic acid-binding protein
VTYLLDTNVVSEWTKPRPSPAVAGWLLARDEDSLHLSVGTLAELRDGVDRLPAGARRRALDRWLTEDLLPRFEGRVLGVDPALADAWGRVTAMGRAAGRPISAIDSLLAATAAIHTLTLVTRNIRDFEGFGVKVIDPWHVD